VRLIVNMKDTIIYYLYDVILNTENKKLDLWINKRHIFYNNHSTKERCLTMSQKNPDQSKIDVLQRNGTFNKRAVAVQDPLFAENDFFDPQDLLQVKYEMLRRASKDGLSITEVCSRFGFSRLSFYRLQTAFRQSGIAGLLSRKRGPRQAHKLSDEVMDFVENAKDKKVGTEAVKKLIGDRFGIRVHRRSIERALGRRKKN
jgi:transposase